MTVATGLGPYPGTDDAAYVETVRILRGELRDLFHVPELPGRGAWAGPVGRALGVIADLGADLQPVGWRLTGGGSGIDQRRARSLLAQDLDRVEELLVGYAGPLKLQLTGPWSLAAQVERPRGDKVLADHGARRDLAQALAAGLGAHLADVRRRVPGATRLIVQLDEPLLAAVHTGRVRTASGFGRHRSVDRAELTAALAEPVSAVSSVAECWVRSAAPDTPWELVRAAGAAGLMVDLDQLSTTANDVLAAALEETGSVALGVIPTAATQADAVALTDRVLRWLEDLGLDPALVGTRLVITPVAGITEPGQVRGMLTLAGAVAGNLTR